jgi:hypothetical protein
MDMAKFSALSNNQWPVHWFKIQADTTWPRNCTLIQKYKQTQHGQENWQ